MPAYSPERRTAVVLSGTGIHGAYHAGVLRALQEAGVKVDLLAGHGAGAANAALARDRRPGAHVGSRWVVAGSGHGRVLLVDRRPCGR